jgi:GAF domain-containing protein
MAAKMDTACEREAANARRRVLNLLSRHPDLIQGNLEAVAGTLCSEAALALACSRVSLWKVEGDLASEKSFNGHVFVDMPTRKLRREDGPAFFAAIERSRVLEAGRLHEFEQMAPGSMVAPILVRGHLWGFFSFEQPQSPSWLAGAFDFSVVLTEMVGRCIEQLQAQEYQVRAERAERGIQGLASLMGDALCFEVVNGVLQFQGVPTNLFGSAPRGSLFDLEQLLNKVNSEDRDQLERRFGDWRSAGSPGALTARLRIGQEEGEELQLECRLLRSKSPSGARLWGMVRPA